MDYQRFNLHIHDWRNSNSCKPNCREQSYCGRVCFLLGLSEHLEPLEAPQTLRIKLGGGASKVSQTSDLVYISCDSHSKFRLCLTFFSSDISKPRSTEGL